MHSSKSLQQQGDHTRYHLQKAPEWALVMLVMTVAAWQSGRTPSKLALIILYSIPPVALLTMLAEVIVLLPAAAIGSTNKTSNRAFNGDSGSALPVQQAHYRVTEQVTADSTKEPSQHRGAIPDHQQTNSIRTQTSRLPMHLPKQIKQRDKPRVHGKISTASHPMSDSPASDTNCSRSTTQARAYHCYTKTAPARNYCTCPSDMAATQNNTLSMDVNMQDDASYEETYLRDDLRELPTVVHKVLPEIREELLERYEDIMKVLDEAPIGHGPSPRLRIEFLRNPEAFKGQATMLTTGNLHPNTLAAATMTTVVARIAKTSSTAFDEYQVLMQCATIPMSAPDYITTQHQKLT